MSKLLHPRVYLWPLISPHLYLLNYFHRLGYSVKDLNDGNATGFSTVQMTVDEGKRMSSAKGTIHKSRHV